MAKKRKRNSKRTESVSKSKDFSPGSNPSKLEPAQESVVPQTRRARRHKFSCQLCKYKFYGAAYFNDHMNSHTGERPYQCESCEKTFSRRSALWNHRRVHVNARPFQCGVCPRKFKWKNSLASHLAAAHAKKAGNDVLNIANGAESSKLTYAAALRPDKSKPLFQLRKRGTNENEEIAAAVLSILEAESVSDGIHSGSIHRGRLPKDLRARDLLLFESKADQVKYESIFADTEGDPNSPIDFAAPAITVEEEVEAFDSADFSYEILACGFQSFAPSPVEPEAAAESTDPNAEVFDPGRASFENLVPSNIATRAQGASMEGMDLRVYSKLAAPQPITGTVLRETPNIGWTGEYRYTCNPSTSNNEDAAAGECLCREVPAEMW